MKATAFISIVLFSFNLLALERPMGFTPEQQEWMAQQNQTTSFFEEQFQSLFADQSDPLTFRLLSETQARPFAEYEDTGYLIISEHFHFNSTSAKMKMAKNLPEGVSLVVYTASQDPTTVQALKGKYNKVIDSDRLKIIYIPGSDRGFWTRDGIPVPVWRSGRSVQDLFTVVDARYYHGFEPDEPVSQFFNAELTRHSYYYEGGNFVANAIGDCLVVNTDATNLIPDATFADHYGCQRLIRLPFLRGIGHADETVKFVDDSTVITDETRYIEILEKQGYKVILLPRAQNKYETYVNSLFINGTVFVPVFGDGKDKEALQIYKDSGFENVVGLESTVLSNQGMGSIHCITMTYPSVPINRLLDSMGARLL